MSHDTKTNRITSDPEVKLGKPVVAGTRITVESILDRLAAGEDIDQLLAAYPHLEREDIQAALQYAADVMRGDTVYPAESDEERRKA
jgi:uncharacterized protein (DUF433 family)